MVGEPIRAEADGTGRDRSREPVTENRSNGIKATDWDDRGYPDIADHRRHCARSGALMLIDKEHGLGPLPVLLLDCRRELVLVDMRGDRLLDEVAKSLGWDRVDLYMSARRTSPRGCRTASSRGSASSVAGSGSRNDRGVTWSGPIRAGRSSR